MKKLSIKKVILFLLGVYVCFMFVSQQIRLSNQASEIEEYTSKLQQEQDKNNKLQDEIKMSTDSSYIEKLAREKLGLIRQGESPVIDSK